VVEPVAKQTNPLERAYRRLDPYQVLAPQAAAYVPRPEPPLAKLVARLRLDSHPGLYVVSGHIGAGKSTELQGLDAQLGVSHHCMLETVDAEIVGDRLDEETFVALLAVAIQAHLENKDIRELLLRARLRPLNDKLNIADMFDGVFNKVMGIPSTPKPQLSRSEMISVALTELRERVVRAERGQREPIVILDGLDKLALADLERLIPWLLSIALPVKVIITVPLSFLFTPMYARHESQIAETAVVPAIRTMQRDGHFEETGIAWMEDILARRGVSELFVPEATRLIVEGTGGILRDFVRVARESVLNAFVDSSDRVHFRHAHNAIQDFAVRLARSINDSDLRLLAAVKRSGRVIGQASFLRLIDSGHIIEYRNGASWYAAHPLIDPAIQALEHELNP
jgi:hypothetical protein